MASNPGTIFESARKAGASDVHLAVGSPVLFRIDGELTKQGKTELTGAEVEGMVKKILGEKKFREFQEKREIDIAYALKSGARLRVNCHYERSFPGLVARLI
ncbi:type IV pili twitching motility protein PilT, partial [Candidatus Peregrinibacteria bacterium CG10_big_fil_rev_8_21_14_0_10_54_7]